MGIEPPPSEWRLPDPARADGSVGDLVGVGADLEPGTVLAAYRRGLFPMPLPEDLQNAGDDMAPIGWWSPDPRGVIPLDGLIVSRSLRKSVARFDVRVNTAFDRVIRACADPDRPHGWIDDDIIRAYTRLHALHWVHSVEAWDRETNELAGGLYGVAIGGLFAGESMFHTATDASKVALVGLVDRMQQLGFALLDVQWATDHLRTLGCIEISRFDYLEQLRSALQLAPRPFGALDQTR